MKLHHLFFVGALMLPLSLPAGAVPQYEQDVTRKWPRVEYGPQTTMYREQCQRWSRHLMWERNKLNKNRDRKRWQASWDLYAGNLAWCQQLPTFEEQQPKQQLPYNRYTLITHSK